LLQAYRQSGKPVEVLSNAAALCEELQGHAMHSQTPLLTHLCSVVICLQAYRQSGKPVEVLSEAERFVMSLMDVPRATPRLRAFALKFTAAEKAAEATAVFRVRRFCCVCSGAFLLWYV
jgi:hypothetical protein